VKQQDKPLLLCVYFIREAYKTWTSKQIKQKRNQGHQEFLDIPDRTTRKASTYSMQARPNTHDTMDGCTWEKLANKQFNELKSSLYVSEK